MLEQHPEIPVHVMAYEQLKKVKYRVCVVLCVCVFSYVVCLCVCVWGGGADFECQQSQNVLNGSTALPLLPLIMHMMTVMMKNKIN